MTGKILGTAKVGALRGSSCLAGNRAVLIGEHDISIVEAPRLRGLWRTTLGRPPRNAAVCGSRVAFVREGETAVQFIDLPPAPSN